MRAYALCKLSMLILGSFMYIIGGIGFCFFPHAILALINLKTTNYIYIRLFGLLAIILGLNYFFMFQQTAVLFFKISIIMRYLATLFILCLVNTGILSYSYLLFLAFVDAGVATLIIVAFWYNSPSIVNKRRQFNNYYAKADSDTV